MIGTRLLGRLPLLLPYLAWTAALKISSALETIEYTPQLVAIQDYYKGGQTQIVNGGVANLFSDRSIDLAANAETQALRNFASHRNLRVIYTIAEVYYRIVANKDRVPTLADLKGKRIGTMSSTSAAYFVSKYLATAGVQESDYTVVSGSTCNTAPCGSNTLPQMLARGAIDAIGLWEPTVQLAIDTLGTNAVVFQNRSVYREVYNLYSTTEKLADPALRKDIVSFVRALNQASADFEKTPDKVIPRVSRAVGIKEDVLKSAWSVHSFRGTLAADLLDVLVEEDKWVARVERRSAIPEAELSKMIDDSVLKEALAG